jgi:hypothetical protein
MSVVSYRCPSTQEEVTTSIESGKDTLLRMRTSNLTLWVHCPHCMAGHQIKAAEASVREHADLSNLVAN